MPSATLRLALAQLNLFVGDVAGNTQRVIDTAARARDELKADVVLFPELTLCGYPPEDLLFHNGLRRQRRVTGRHPPGPLVRQTRPEHRRGRLRRFRRSSL